MLFQDEPSEFTHNIQNYTFTLGMLANITRDLSKMVTPATNGNELVPDYLLDTVNNLIEAIREYIVPRSKRASRSVNTSWTDDVLKKTVKVADDILKMYSHTLISGEVPVEFYTECLSVEGKKLLGKDLGNYIFVSGATFFIPSFLPPGHQEDEIFRSIFVLPSNPFEWGMIYPITSTVARLSLTDTTNGYTNITIPIRDLDETTGLFCTSLPNRTMVWGESTGTIGNQIIYTDISISPGQVSVINTNHSEIYTAWHMQVRVVVLPNNDENDKDAQKHLDFYAFLGEGYQPTKDNFDQCLRLTYNTMMSNDHHNYTFFVGQR